MNIFVGNLSFEAKEVDVQRVFMAFGVVTSVAIVMEKKGKKSRGFGFVQMPDEQEAVAAIAQLQGKEILGRPINVLPSVSNKRGDGSIFLESNVRKIEPSPSSKRTGKYKEGRRSLSYVKQRTDAGITTPVPERRYKSNPLRWLKKPRTQARFAKSEGELKPWQRPQTESNPWKKPMAKSGSWKKPEGELKPWQKTQGESKPWEKSRGGSRPWIKAQGSQAKPWKKAEEVSRPWKKSASAAKPWRKSSADRQQSGLKKRSSFRKS
jgi:RNA recognition motif-containing protein